MTNVYAGNFDLLAACRKRDGWQRLNIFPGRLHHELSLLGSLVAGSMLS